jgi:hypothetical protein
MAFHYSPKIVTDGLVFYVDAANPKSFVDGNTTWNDLSRSGNNGTLTNGPTYDSGNGGNIVFDGLDDYAIVSQSDDFKFGTGDFCYDVWFSCDNITNSNGGYFDRLIFMGNTVFINSFSINANTGGYQIRFNDAVSITTSIIPINTWTNLIIQRQSGVLYAYINGVLDKSASNNYNMDTAADYELNLGFAGIRTPNSSYFNGNISSVKIYNNALTETQIKQNYNALKTRFGL